MKARPVLGWFLAAISLAALALAWGGVFAPLARTTFGVTMLPHGNDTVVARTLPGSRAAAVLKAGDVVDVLAMPVGDRLRLEVGSPPGTTLEVPITRRGVRRIVQVRAQASSRPPNTLGFLPELLDATVALLVLGFIGLRRPSLAAAALVFYGIGAIETSGLAAQFTWLPDPLFGIVAVVLMAAFSGLPLLALLPFITRFPEPPSTGSGRRRRWLGDAIFLFGAAMFTVQVLFEPLLFETWLAFNTWSSVVEMAVVILFAALAYHDAAGEVRRRISWVIAGLVVSAVGFTGFNVADSLFLFAGQVQTTVLVGFAAASQAIQCALPIALAYAVLRHRVLDIGFALNRTVVYGVMTALVVVVVSLIDWLTTRLLNQQRLALAIEALVTISFGFALNSIHKWTERLIDRIVFRERHLAEKRIESRIGALSFSHSAASVDEAIARDGPAILGLASAAVFTRLSATDPFTRAVASAWPDDAVRTIDDDAVLVRTLRSVERPIVLDDVAISLGGVPHGEARPAIAIPIVAQHDLIGFALYGNRRDGALPDPEEIGLLARLCDAAGNAYGAVEVHQWRERAASLERSISTLLPQHEGTLAKNVLSS